MYPSTGRILQFLTIPAKDVSPHAATTEQADATQVSYRESRLLVAICTRACISPVNKHTRQSAQVFLLSYACKEVVECPICVFGDTHIRLLHVCTAYVCTCAALVSSRIYSSHVWLRARCGAFSVSSFQRRLLMEGKPAHARSEPLHAKPGEPEMMRQR